VQKHFYKIIAKNKKGANAEYTDSARNNKLDTEGVAHPFGVTDAVILRGENTRTGNRAEYSEVENKDELVDYRYSRHCLCTERANHYVIEKIHEIRDTVLYDDGDGNGKRAAVECLVPD
jgi:hypothetical protein